MQIENVKNLLKTVLKKTVIPTSQVLSPFWLERSRHEHCLAPTFQISAWTGPGFYWAPRWSDWARASFRTEAAVDGRGSGDDQKDCRAGTAAGCRDGTATPAEDHTLEECWVGWAMAKERWRSPGLPEAHKSSLFLEGVVASVFLQACRAILVAGMNLETK